jgi:hypothetical protein
LAADVDEVPHDAAAEAIPNATHARVAATIGSYDTRFTRPMSAISAASGAGQNRILYDRVDLAAPAITAEHAIMADARLQVVTFHIGPQAARKVLSRERLADAADVVPLAFYREQHGALDRARIDLLTTPLQFAACEVRARK